MQQIENVFTTLYGSQKQIFIKVRSEIFVNEIYIRRDDIRIMRSFGAHREKVTDTLCDNTTLFSEHHISIARSKMTIPFIGDVPLRHWTIGSHNPETRRHILE